VQNRQQLSIKTTCHQSR